MRILVTGGRKYHDRTTVWKALDEFRLAHESNVIIHGACHLGGADLLADEYARYYGWEIEAYPVAPGIDGPWPGAGPRRNQRMLDTSKPDVCVAFLGGSGTADMVRRARLAGVPVRQIP